MNDFFPSILRINKKAVFKKYHWKKKPLLPLTLFNCCQQKLSELRNLDEYFVNLKNLKLEIYAIKLSYCCYSSYHNQHKMYYLCNITKLQFYIFIWRRIYCTIPCIYTLNLQTVWLFVIYKHYTTTKNGLKTRIFSYSFRSASLYILTHNGLFSLNACWESTYIRKPELQNKLFEEFFE